MKKILIAIISILTISSLTYAFPGSPGHGPVFGPGSGAEFIFSGEHVSVNGIVAGVGYFGQGVQIDDGSGIVNVYGMGPVWFWESQGSSFPSVGEPITIEGYRVTLADGIPRIIATAATMYGHRLELRNPTTGIPSWREAAWDSWNSWSASYGQQDGTTQAPIGPAIPGGFGRGYGRGYGMMGWTGYYAPVAQQQPAP